MCPGAGISVRAIVVLVLFVSFAKYNVSMQVRGCGCGGFEQTRVRVIINLFKILISLSLPIAT